AALPPAREECAVDGLQVRRVRRGADVRSVAEETVDAVANEESRGQGLAVRKKYGFVFFADLAPVSDWRQSGGAGVGGVRTRTRPGGEGVGSVHDQTRHCAPRRRTPGSSGHLRSGDADAGRATGRNAARDERRGRAEARTPGGRAARTAGGADRRRPTGAAG